jgi:hypothetical protein
MFQPLGDGQHDVAMESNGPLRRRTSSIFDLRFSRKLVSNLSRNTPNWDKVRLLPDSYALKIFKTIGDYGSFIGPHGPGGLNSREAHLPGKTRS